MSKSTVVIDDHALAAVARALSNPARIKILRLLAAQTECRGTEVFTELPLAQSTISEHLRVLKEAGLVTSSPVGTAMTYCLRREPLEDLLSSLEEIATTMPQCDSEGNRC